jgi:hypothetical protein
VTKETNNDMEKPPTLNATSPGSRTTKVTNNPHTYDQVSEKVVKCLGIQNATLDAFGLVDQAYCAFWGFLDKISWRSNSCTIEPNIRGVQVLCEWG